MLASGEALTAGIARPARRVVAVDAAHPLAEGAWHEVRVDRALALAAPAGETILALADSAAEARGGKPEAAPLLVERRIGKGRALTLLTALDRNWSSLVLRPAFVGLIGNAVRYLADPLAGHVRVGEAIALAGASAQIFDAEGPPGAGA